MSNQNRVAAGVPSGGQFSQSTRSEADVSLDGAPARAYEPLNVTVHLQAWDERDNIIHVDDIEFDAAPLLARMEPELRERMLDVLGDGVGDADLLFHDAVRTGLVADWVGPFDVRADEREAQEWAQEFEDTPEVRAAARREILDLRSNAAEQRLEAARVALDNARADVACATVAQRLIDVDEDTIPAGSTIATIDWAEEDGLGEDGCYAVSLSTVYGPDGAEIGEFDSLTGDEGGSFSGESGEGDDYVYVLRDAKTGRLSVDEIRKWA